MAHSLAAGGRRWTKGVRLTAADVAALTAAGHDFVTVAQLDSGDIGEDDAAMRLAAALAGPGLTALPPVHGRVNLAAQNAGLLLLPAGLVAAVNAADEAITLATLPAHTRVAAGGIVATIKIIRYAAAADALAAAIAAVQMPISLAAFQPRRVALIATTLAGTSAKAMAKLERVTGARIAALAGAMEVLAPCPHDAAALAAVLGTTTADLVLIAGASATVDRGDVVPQAIELAGGTVARLGMPVDPGNLLVLGALRGTPVIGLPGCARSPKRNGLDLVLERLFAGLPVGSAEIAAMGEGGLLPEAERPEPRVRAARPARVGAVVLAAGRSSRFGEGHKLLADWHGRPLIAHSIDAIIMAGLPPPIVVLGHAARAVRAALSGRTVQFVEAADWAEGMGRSLAAGITAVPADWDAALVCLADMPAVEPALIAALAAAPGAVVVPEFQGRRGHPVRWPRAAFPQLAAITGDIGGRALMENHVITVLPAPSDACLYDVDTPAALAALRKPLEDDA